MLPLMHVAWLSPKATRLLGAALLLALAAIGPVAGQNTPSGYVEPANLAALVAAAAKEGVLTLSASDTFGGSKGAQVLQQHIEQKYHIAFAIHYAPVGSGGAFLRQLAQEVRAGTTASSDIAFTANDRSLAADSAARRLAQIRPRFTARSRHIRSARRQTHDRACRILI